MKKQVLLIPMLLVFLAGCMASERTKIPQGHDAKPLAYDENKWGSGNTGGSGNSGNSMNTGNSINTINLSASIKQGYIGRLSIKALPDTGYTLTAVYRDGDKVLTARQSKITDYSGQASWSWTVSKTTAPGTYPLIISGGGDTYNATYTVIR